MNGIWNELLIFNDVLMNLNDKTSWPIFLLNVFDYNKIKSNVPLGYNYVWLCSSAYAINETLIKLPNEESINDPKELERKLEEEKKKLPMLQPKWHNLFLPKSNKQQGQILLSFFIFDKTKYTENDLKPDNLRKRINFIPQVTLYDCDI